MDYNHEQMVSALAAAQYLVIRARDELACDVAVHKAAVIALDSLGDLYQALQSRELRRLANSARADTLPPPRGYEARIDEIRGAL